MNEKNPAFFLLLFTLLQKELFSSLNLSKPVILGVQLENIVDSLQHGAQLPIHLLDVAIGKCAVSTDIRC